MGDLDRRMSSELDRASFRQGAIKVRSVDTLHQDAYPGEKILPACRPWGQRVLQGAGHPSAVSQAERKVLLSF